MSLLTTFDTTKNFWQMNPQFKNMGPIMEYHKNDKSKGKTDSSKIMWAIAQLLDPHKDNTYRNLSRDRKEDLLKKDFIKRPRFSWGNVKDITDFYREMVMFQAEKSLDSWNEIISMRDKELKKLYRAALKSGDVKMITELDKLVAVTPKFFSDYMKIKEAFDKEVETIQHGKGNKVKSMTDSNQL